MLERILGACLLITNIRFWEDTWYIIALKFFPYSIIDCLGIYDSAIQLLKDRGDVS